MRRLIAGIAALLSTAGTLSASAQPGTWKLINYRGGLVVFSVPKSWVEEYEPEGGGTFYEPGDNTGTLRLNVISAKPPASAAPLLSKQVLSSIGHSAPEILPNGNAISKSMSRTAENGTPITIFWWYVASVVNPEHVRIANFSYTILSSEEYTERTISELSSIEKAIRNASFSPVVEK